MLRTARSLPLEGFRRWASTRPVSRPSRQPATGPPGSYPDRTSTGRRRRAYEHEDPPWHYVTASPPALLGAHNRPLPLITRTLSCGTQDSARADSHALPLIARGTAVDGSGSIWSTPPWSPASPAWALRARPGALCRPGRTRSPMARTEHDLPDSSQYGDSS